MPPPAAPDWCVGVVDCAPARCNPRFGRSRLSCAPVAHAPPAARVRPAFRPAARHPRRADRVPAHLPRWCRGGHGSSITWSCRCARVSASSAPKGSSSSSTFGFIDSARAMPMRCFMPPEISAGRLSFACGHLDQRQVLQRPVMRARRAVIVLANDLVDGQPDVLVARSATAAGCGSGRPRRGRARAVDLLAFQQHAAGGRRQQAGDDVEQGRLAAAGMADDRRRTRPWRSCRSMSRSTSALAAPRGKRRCRRRSSSR